MNSYLIICICMYFTIANAWYNEGHMIISEIAYQLSTDDMKYKIDSLISVLSEKYPDYQDHLTASVWADDIKKTENTQSAYWHFIKLPYVLDNVTYESPYNSVNIINILEQLTSNFTEFAYTEDQAQSFYFILHLLGDIHMPLHVGSLYSKQFIQSDNNGALYSIKYNNTSLSLHSFIDSGANKYNHYYPLPISDSDKKTISSLAYNISTLCDITYSFSPATWANESISYLPYIYSNIQYDSSPSETYIEYIQNMTAYQFCIAGHRLAGVFNELLIDRQIAPDFYLVLTGGFCIIITVIVDEYLNRKGITLNNKQQNSIKSMKIVSSNQI